MTNPIRNRLRQAIEHTAARLSEVEACRLARSGPPQPGDLYVFDAGEIALEWLVVRAHPDDAELLLLVPGDDFPLAGPPDVQIPRRLVNRPYTIRCGEAIWAPAGFCEPRLRVGSVASDVTRLVRARVASLARGKLEPTEDDVCTNADAEYAEWMQLVCQARELVQRRADCAITVAERTVIKLPDFTDQLPAALAGEPQFSLAAESGSPFLSCLSEQITESTVDNRYHEIEVKDAGKLILQTAESGIRLIWAGAPEDNAPKVQGRIENGDIIEVTWQLGPEGKVRRSATDLPWVDGQVVVTVNTNPPQTLTIQR